MSTSQMPPAQRLPEYQPLQYPLDEKSKETLLSLQSKYPFADFQMTLKSAAKLLQRTVGDINDRYYEQEHDYNSKKRRRGEAEGDEAELDQRAREDEHIAWMRRETEKMTTRMETSVRTVIDNEEHLANLQRSLRDLSANILGSSTQATAASQRAARVTQPGSTAISDEDGNLHHPPPESLLSTLEKNLERARNQYEAQTKRARYANNGTYKTFKGILHDAQDGKEADSRPPMDSRYWFSVEDGGSPPPGMTDNTQGEDDDITIARVNISTTCPITLLPFQDPVTSTKCPHSFERRAIVGMIKKAPSTVNVGRNKRVQVPQMVECPVGGCDQKLQLEDLKEDPILIRKIKRIQRERQLREQNSQRHDEESQGASRGHLPEEISDADESGDDVDREAQRRVSAIRVKREQSTREDQIEDEEDPKEAPRGLDGTMSDNEESELGIEDDDEDDNEDDESEDESDEEMTE